MVFSREDGERSLIVRANLSSDPVKSADPGGELVLGNYADPRRDGELRAWEVVVTESVAAS